jgi:hypothetical protein
MLSYTAQMGKNEMLQVGPAPFKGVMRLMCKIGGDGTYTIPNLGALPYCGLEGWMYPLRQIIENNDLGHPLCAHLREGTWAMDYVINRLEK